MRKKTVKIAGRLVTVSEMKVGELKALASKYVGDYEIYRKQQMKTIANAAIGMTPEQRANLQVDLIGELAGYIQTKVVELFPELEGVSLEDLYPSEIEELADAFIEVNFTGARKLMSEIFKFAERASKFTLPGAGA